MAPAHRRGAASESENSSSDFYAFSRRVPYVRRPYKQIQIPSTFREATFAWCVKQLPAFTQLHLYPWLKKPTRVWYEVDYLGNSRRIR